MHSQYLEQCLRHSISECCLKITKIYEFYYVSYKLPSVRLTEGWAVPSSAGVPALWHHELHVWGRRHCIHGVPFVTEQTFHQACAPALQAL